jgi:peptide deformylase
MAVLPIERLGSPVLRREAEPVKDFGDDLKTLVRDMFETMYYAEGVGLAAPQIGRSLQLLVMDTRNEVEPEAGRLALVNPRITQASRATERGTEGCLSIPGVDEQVDRALQIVVEGQDVDGREIELVAEGFTARVLQHEIDHLNGVLFIDRLSPLKRELLLSRYRKLEEEE